MLYPLSYGGLTCRSHRISGPSPRLARDDRADRSEQRRRSDAGQTTATGAVRLPRVLVVDDDEVIRQLITLNLELEGFEVHEAVDGADALSKVVEVRPGRDHARHHDAQHGRLGRGRAGCAATP